MKQWDAFIEATIDAIHFNAEKRELSFDVTCQLESGHRKRLVIDGVDDFVANEMRLQNIIDRIHQYRGDETEAARCLFFLMRGREPEEDELRWPQLVEKLDHVRTGRRVLLEIEPVYGATLIILGENVRLESIGD
ncbi:MAG TPA: hypothetical protein VEC35_18370 [Noviherbaspirillum sp.]|nr:hypothetical protein [Noviherbaspirillum sp.]